MDNHGSHCTIRFLRTCLERQIMLLFLPPHTSHILQLLDVGCFSPLKSYFRRELQRLRGYHDQDHIQRDQMIELYVKARRNAFTVANIEASWRKSGIWPRNVDIPLSSKFIKEQADSEHPEVTNMPLKMAIRGQELVKLDSREARIASRDIAQKLREKDAEIIFLKAQLARQNEQVQHARTTRKRKRVANEDSNEKLISVRSILGTQELAEKEQIEEEKRKQRKIQRAQNALSKAQKSLSNLQPN